jgi:protease-4
VDVLGGFSQALAIAKEKAGIPLDQRVTLVEFSRETPSIGALLSGLGGARVESLAALVEASRNGLQSSAPQYRMEAFELLDSGLGSSQTGSDLQEGADVLLSLLPEVVGDLTNNRK